MKWKPISKIHDEDDYIPFTHEAQIVLLYDQRLDEQHDFPGHPYSLSNIVYAKIHYTNRFTHYKILKEPNV